jgi:hypothetical protein
MTNNRMLTNFDKQAAILLDKSHGGLVRVKPFKNVTLGDAVETLRM